MPTAQHPKPDTGITQPKNRPAAEFRDHKLRATIWTSLGEDGFTRYNVILNRSYKVGEQWKETPYLGHLDLQRARKLLDRADDWISSAFASNREAEAQAAIA